jgi:tetratricopeptide (TPR) repeat protein
MPYCRITLHLVILINILLLIHNVSNCENLLKTACCAKRKIGIFIADYELSIIFHLEIRGKMLRSIIFILLSIVFFSGCAATSHHSATIPIDTRSAEIFNQRGNDYFVKGQYDLAMVEYKKAIATFPQYAKAHSNLGYTHFEMRQYDHAIAEFTKAIDSNPRYAKAYNNRGLVYFTRGEYDRAISDFNKAIEIDPNLAKPYDNRGTVYLLTGDTEKACTDFVHACELGECSTYDMLKKDGFCDLEYLAMADIH